jgi:hypothetical protein
MMLEAEAVADLIAAAPALLECLEALLAKLDSTEPWAKEWKEAESAVARARGHNETP